MAGDGRRLARGRHLEEIVWRAARRGESSGESDLLKNAGHSREQIHGDAVGFGQLDAECMHGEHRPFCEPASPFGVGGFVRISDN